MTDENYMLRCIELAKNGLGNVSPNPMVGAVIVCDNKIIGEGYHQQYGEAHAEVNAIASVQNKKLLSKSTLYVSLEPCNHQGKTPPCVDLIIQHKIPKVVIGSVDTNTTVTGDGIKKLQQAGIIVKQGILEAECNALNKRFFHFYEKKQPYIILKWAQTKDGFIDDSTQKSLAITNEISNQLVHKWRAEEDAILIGTNAARIDNPSLTTRLWKGKNPVRIVIDWENKLSPSLHLFNQQTPTLVFNRKSNSSKKNLEYISITKSKNDFQNILNVLYKKRIQSMIVEGGTKLLHSFIECGLWNEARIFTAPFAIGNGVKAPKINGKIIAIEKIKDDELIILQNK